MGGTEGSEPGWHARQHLQAAAAQRHLQAAAGAAPLDFEASIAAAHSQLNSLPSPCEPPESCSSICEEQQAQRQHKGQLSAPSPCEPPESCSSTCVMVQRRPASMAAVITRMKPTCGRQEGAGM